MTGGRAEPTISRGVARPPVKSPLQRCVGPRPAAGGGRAGGGNAPLLPIEPVVMGEDGAGLEYSLNWCAVGGVSMLRRSGAWQVGQHGGAGLVNSNWWQARVACKAGVGAGARCC